MGAVTPEEKLVEAAQRGDLDAFEALVNQNQAAVITTAFHLLGDETEADDVAQEVWLRAYHALPRFRFQSKFSTWLYRITVNQSMTALKKRKNAVRHAQTGRSTRCHGKRVPSGDPPARPAADSRRKRNRQGIFPGHGVAPP